MDEATISLTRNSGLPADPSLFTRIAAGDEEAFGAFYRQLVPQLRPFIFSITQSDMMVDEVIQESFLRFWLNRDKLPGIKDPKAWLFKITGNICYSLFQRSLTERKVLDRVGLQTTLVHSDTTDLLQLNFLKTALQQGVQLLSPQRKKIYCLNREQGLSPDEIASQLNLSVQTVRNTLSASLEFLRDHLSRQGYTISVITVLFFRS